MKYILILHSCSHEFCRFVACHYEKQLGHARNAARWAQEFSPTLLAGEEALSEEWVETQHQLFDKNLPGAHPFDYKYVEVPDIDSINARMNYEYRVPKKVCIFYFILSYD